MIQSDKTKLFRAWYGYRMMFNHELPLKLDSEYIPIFKQPKFYGSQKEYMVRNMEHMVDNLPPKTYFLFMLANNFSTIGGMLHPFEIELSDNAIKKMYDNYVQYVTHDHITDYNVLKNISGQSLNTFEVGKPSRLITMLLDGDISIISLMMYSTKHDVDLSSMQYIENNGLVSDYIVTCIKIGMRLQREYDICYPILQLRKQLILENKLVFTNNDDCDIIDL